MIFKILLILFLTTPFLLADAHQHNHHYQNHLQQDLQQPMANKASLNVFKSPLAYFGGSPITTGFMRNGYCEVPPSDFGNHAVAAEVTDEFLTFSAAQGNDLRSIGLKGGCKWCLCVTRWREAFDARKSDSDPIVPKVFLNATNEKALNKVTLDELRKFAAKE